MAVPSGVHPDKKERNRYAALAFCWGDLLFELDGNGTVVFCAGPLVEFTGRKSRDVTGLPFLELMAPSDETVLTRFFKTARARGRGDGELIHLRRGGSTLLPMQISGYCMDERLYLALRLHSGKPVPAEAGGGGLRDPDSFSQQASRRIKELEQQGQQAGITVLDLAGLTDLSETLSEQESSELLSSVGACLSQNSLAGDTATRIGGDSFSLVHDATLDVGVLRTQLLDAVHSAAPAGAGVEIAHSTTAMDAAQEVSEQDLAKGLMYALAAFQKKSGSDFNISTLTDNMSTLFSQGISEIRDFRRILSERRFVMALQPIVDTRTGAVHHFEALCRFNPALPDQSPYRHITFAEETGLIHEFDLAVVVKVVQWLRTMPVNNRKFSVAVNISGYSIGVPEYVQGIHDLLRANPWVQDRLMFEITESARMSDLEAANDFIQGLRRLGYKVCLDDFGAGAASFQYLSALEVDVVKIDGSAVRNAQRGPKGRAFLSALTELCARLGVETIAEMIDSPESLRFVRDCRCNYVQGFLFGKPSRNVSDFAPLPNIELFR